MKGSRSIHPGTQLVLAVLACILLLAPSWASGAGSLPRSGSGRSGQTWDGDLVLTEDKVLMSTSITLKGNLTIRCNLTFVSVELLISSPAGERHGITVEQGWRFFIVGSKVAPAEPGGRYFFRVRPRASLHLDRSEVTGCGWTPHGKIETGELDQRGLYLAGSETAVTSTKISQGGTGLVVANGSSPVISGCDIFENDVCGIAVTGGSAPTIEKNTIRDNAANPWLAKGGCADILSFGSSPLVVNNTLSSSAPEAPGLVYHGIQLLSSDGAVVSGNLISGHRGPSPCAGILAVDSTSSMLENRLLGNTVGLEVLGGSSRMEANLFDGLDARSASASSKGAWDLSSSSTFTGNTFKGCRYGALVEGPSLSTFRDDAFTGNAVGFGALSSSEPYRVRAVGPSFEGNQADIELASGTERPVGGHLTLVDPSYDSESVRFHDAAAVLTVERSLRVRAGWAGTERPVERAAVEVRDALGARVGTLMTGPDGWTNELVVEDYSRSGDLTSKRSPFTVAVLKGNISWARSDVRMDGGSEVQAVLGDIPPELGIALEDRAGKGTGSFPEDRPLRFSPEGLEDLPGPDVAFFWDFGDGQTSEDAAVNHTYRSPGVYDAVLTVTKGNSTLRVRRSIEVRPSPVVSAGQDGAAGLAFLVLGLAVLAVAAFFIGGTETGLLAFFSFFMWLYSKISREHILDNFIRGKIYGYIIANPGDHYNAIMLSLKLPNGTFAYHIKRLEKENLVKSQWDGLNRRYYPAEMVVPAENEKSLTRIQRLIWDIIAEKPGISQKELAAMLNVSSATINYHVDILLSREVLRRERVGMKVRYYSLTTGRATEDSRMTALLIPPP